MMSQRDTSDQCRQRFSLGSVTSLLRQVCNNDSCWLTRARRTKKGIVAPMIVGYWSNPSIEGAKLGLLMEPNFSGFNSARWC